MVASVAPKKKRKPDNIQEIPRGEAPTTSMVKHHLFDPSFKTKCECEDIQEELFVKHILLECNKYQKEREESRLGKKLEEILAPEISQDAPIFKFIKLAKLKV